MSAQSLYQQKRMSAADAIRVVRNGDTIVVPTAVGEPPGDGSGLRRAASQQLHGQGLLIVQKSGAVSGPGGQEGEGDIQDYSHGLASLKDAGHRSNREEPLQPGIAVSAQIIGVLSPHHHHAAALAHIFPQLIQTGEVGDIVQDDGLVSIQILGQL